MSVKPILFNTDMVQAILDGRKTVTRRAVKPQPVCYGSNLTFKQHNADFFLAAEKGWLRCRTCGHDPEYSQEGSSIAHHWRTPYQPGDILYVRETWQCINPYSDKEYVYKASCDADFAKAIGNWCPSIHMPKEAARLWLEVTDVRVERLHRMSHEAAKQEGIHYCESPDGFTWKTEASMNCCYVTPSGAFEALWNSTVKKEDMDRYSWESNPWVWVIEFERCKKPQEESVMDQHEAAKIPFIRFLYADGNGARKIYDTAWPAQFITDFTDVEVTEIGGFFVMGFPQSVKTLEDAFKICRG
ncbi:hypothetical protein 10S8_18 [uncultured Caudovirales phage]|uniref:Uncharacterized protein n=1 Tax=uncultured Caudovirales phage TaxID=2100421 RepID=A0A2H4J8I2_9CAUD|nr:hypothetical protein 10S8_18 [uncultured Caudovirales phage]